MLLFSNIKRGGVKPMLKKTAELVYLGIPYLKNNKTGRTLLGQYCVKKFIVS